MCKDLRVLRWLGIGLILIVGIIHVIDAPDSFQEAAYKGWLFYANGAGAVIAAYGIFRKQCWGWVLGLMVAAGAFLGYVASRTVGLPLIPAEPSAWLEPLGVVSLLAEAAFIVVSFLARAASKVDCQTPRH
jgi:uncharacterized membrane protein YfcA